MEQLEQNIALALYGLHHVTAENTMLPAWSLPNDWGQKTADNQAAYEWAHNLAVAGQKPLLGNKHRVSIFAGIQRKKADAPLSHRFIPPAPLSLTEETLFPKINAELPADNRELIDAFQMGLAYLEPIADGAAYLPTLYDLLRRTTWCLPAPYGLGSEPDVSLFDYARVIAALMPCYRGQDSAVTFINGDLSGVQDFLYTITARGAVSGLRGRSFYLQLLTEACARYLLGELQLPQTSLIFSSGGHFLMLAPSRVGDKIKEAQQAISDLLLNCHRGDLYLALGSHEFQTADFHPNQFSSAWTLMSQNTQRAKRRRFSELGESMFEAVFTPQGGGGDEKTDCAVCHYDGPDMVQDIKDGVSIFKCRLCHSLEELGKDLRQATHLLLVNSPPREPEKRTWLEILGGLGFQAAAFNQNSNHQSGKLPSGSQAELVCLNESTADDRQLRKNIEREKKMPVALNGRFVVNVTPLVSQSDREKILADFEEEAASEKLSPDEKTKQYRKLANVGDVREFSLMEEDAVGIKRLGVLRMDVDGLGDIFAGGFGEGQSSLTRTATLSFAMSLYFEGWVEKLANEADIDPETGERRHVVYSVYSGGDDLFIVGAWDVLPQLAYEINRDLRRYAAGNPAVHASAGITLHTGKYPLYQAAENAHDALEAAKDFEGENGRKKDAFTFLGQTRPWLDFEDILKEKQRLFRLVNERGTPRSLIQQLIRLHKRYLDHQQKSIEAGESRQSVYWGPWHWLSAYRLHKMISRVKNQEAKDEIQIISDSLSGDKFHKIALLGISARWAELSVRNKSDDDNED